MPSASVLPPSARDRLLTALSTELESLTDAGLLRHVTLLEAVDGPLVRIGGRPLICWCSNDYLGLAGHPAIVQAAAQAARDGGFGAGASRLLAGTTRWHAQLERGLAEWFGAEDAIVYPSGYLANLGTLGALLSSQDAVYVDRLAHASLLDAARLSHATFRVFHHNDLEHLAALLARAHTARRRLIVTEGVFSMDGDAPPLAALLDVAQTHDAMVYLDDAHGAFVLGESGRGTPDACGLSPERFLYMGTLGKALGGQGGFVIGPHTLIDWLRNRARTFIYTTAPAVPIMAAATAALEVLRREPQRRSTLQDRVTALHRRLQSLPKRFRPASASHIMPIRIGETRVAFALTCRLWERGVWAPAIRPPTVPNNSARLRLSVTALHTDAHIDQLAEALTHELAGV